MLLTIELHIVNCDFEGPTQVPDLSVHINCGIAK